MDKLMAWFLGRAGGADKPLATRAFGAVEELFHAVEEALGLRVSFLAAILRELFEQLALFGGEVDRRFHQKLDVQIAAILAAQMAHAFAFDAEAAAGLCAGGD